MRRDALLRAVGVLTAGYSLAITAQPKVLAGPTGQVAADGTVPTAVAELTRSIGVRDASLALALVAAPAGRPQQIVTAARVLSDAADAVWFARLIRQTGGERSQVAKVCGVAIGWACLEAYAGWRATRA